MITGAEMAVAELLAVKGSAAEVSPVVFGGVEQTTDPSLLGV